MPRYFFDPRNPKRVMPAQAGLVPDSPKAAYDKDGNEIPPLTLAAMREHGVRSILVWCNACNRDASFNADHLPDDLPVRDVALRMHCEQCSSKNIATFPERWVTGA